MSKILIWDIPTRLVHWAFAVSVTAALATSFLVDHDHPLFPLHILFGIVALFLLCLRGMLGLAGSRYARFASYPVRPREIVEYMIAAFTGKTKRYPGNNPGSALAAVLMFGLVVLLLLSGIGFGGEALGELHEAFAYALLAIITLHLLGIGWHTVRHRENLALAMISGRKQGAAADGIGSAHPVWGLAFLIASAVWVAALFGNYDSNARKVVVPLAGVTVQLGNSDSSDDNQRRGEDDD